MESLFQRYMSDLCNSNPDPSHDILHVKRVVGVAKKLCIEENASIEVVVPAAYLHDCVYISKSDPRRKQASQLSATKAKNLLKQWNYPDQFIDDIAHAIEAHSFSANITALSLEAKIVQDADRLDAIGAVGIMRCFSFSGLSNRSFYNSVDPFCSKRLPDDSNNALDHFFVKLMKIPQSLHTRSAQAEAKKRLSTMNSFLSSLRAEI